MSDWPKILALFEVMSTTLVSQLYTLRLCEKGAVVAVGLVCGNALLISSTLQKDPFNAVVAGVYGLSTVSFSTLELVSSIIFIQINPLTASSTSYYLILWAWINALFFIHALRHRRVLQCLFFACVVAGSLLETIDKLGGVNMHLIPNYVIIASVIFPMTEISRALVIGPLTMGERAESGSDLDVFEQVTGSLGLQITQPV
jgi:succinate-acetate transporter protein